MLFHNHAGHSFKQHEVVEASYRITVGHRQTYIKLVDAGWVFDVGVRGSYKDKPIMKCIATESYVAEEDSSRKLRIQAGRLNVRGGPRKSGTSVVEISREGLTVYYRQMGTEKLALVEGTVCFPLSNSEGQEQRFAWAESKLARGRTSSLHKTVPPPCYYEVTVHCGGARQEIRIGLLSEDENMSCKEVAEAGGAAPGMGVGSVGLRMKDWSIWCNNENLFCGREKEGEGMMGMKGALEDDDDDQSLLSRFSDEGAATSSLARPLDLRDLSNIRKLFGSGEAHLPPHQPPTLDGSLSFCPENLLGLSPMPSSLGEAKAVGGRQRENNPSGEESKTVSKEVKTEDDVWYGMEPLNPDNDPDEKIAAANKMLLEALVASETGPNATEGFEAKASSRHSRTESSLDETESTLTESTHDKVLFAPLKDGDVVGCGIDHFSKKASGYVNIFNTGLCHEP